MVDKKIFRRWIYCLILQVVVFILATINSFNDEFNQDRLYNLPFGKTGAEQQIYFHLLWLTLPYLAIILGFALSAAIVRLYTKLTKYSKRIEFVGFSRVVRKDSFPLRRYGIQLIFGILLCLNIWIFILSSNVFDVWVSNSYKDQIYDADGRLYNFPMVPWYWVPVFITTLIFAMCYAIIDSGLVSIRKLPEHESFSDTERVGDHFLGAVKGYAGISVVINFFIVLQSPIGKELSLVLYPLMAFIQLITFVIAIDLFKDIGRRWVFNAVKHQYNPELIELNYEKKPIEDFKEIFE